MERKILIISLAFIFLFSLVIIPTASAQGFKLDNNAYLNKNNLGNFNVSSAYDICITGGNCLSNISNLSYGNVSGVGTTNYIPKFNSPSTLDNSNIYQSGSNIGINTLTPNSELQVDGYLRLAYPADESKYINFWSDNYWSRIQATGTSGFVIRGGTILFESGSTVGINMPYLRPWTDLITNLGTSSTRWKTFYSHYITDGGNGFVGINTLTPQNTLNIVGDGNFTSNLYTYGDFYSNNGNIYNVSLLKMNSNYAMTGSEPVGGFYWNSVEGCYEIKVNSNVTTCLDDGKIYGKATEPLKDGDVVEYAGSQGDHFLFKKANVTEIKNSPHLLLGVATDAMIKNDFGYVQVEGYVHDVYTKSPSNGDGQDWNLSDELYFNWSSGNLTNVKPLPPNRIIIFGEVNKLQTGNAQNGDIYLRISVGLNIDDISNVNDNCSNGEILAMNITSKTWDCYSLKDNYYNQTQIKNFGYWNNTYATFNKTYADTLYYPLNTNPSNYINWSQITNGTLALNSTLSNYIPYTGAAQNINLGNNNFSIGGNDLFVDSSTGNVGIGNSSPSTKFTVQTGPSTYVTFKEKSVLFGFWKIPELSFVGDIPGSIKNGLYIRASSTNLAQLLFSNSDVTSSAQLSYNTTNDQMEFRLASGGYTFNDGNVGIGTQTPNQKLQIVGDENISGTLHYGALEANSPHAFLADDHQNYTRICVEATDGKVIMQVFEKNNQTGEYEMHFRENQSECYKELLISKTLISNYSDINGIPTKVEEEVSTYQNIWTKEKTNKIKEYYSTLDNYLVGKHYYKGDAFIYNGQAYEVLQDHTSQSDWIPDQVPALYKKKILYQYNQITQWTQPTGSTDCYPVGAIVTYNGKTYENQASCNVWVPGVYGWVVK